MSLTVRVITPDQTVWDAAAEEVVLPSTTGQVGILGGHAPLLTALDTGVMRLRPEKDWLAIAISGGFAEVEDDEVVVLVNGAERGDAIDADEARSNFESAQSRLAAAEKGEDRQEQLQAKADFKRARARLQAATGVAV